MSVVECDFQDATLGIERDFASDVKNIAHHTQDAEVPEWWSMASERALSPTNEIVTYLA